MIGTPERRAVGGEHREVGAGLSPVAGDIGEDDCGDAGLAEAHCGFGNGQLTGLHPSFDCEAAVAHVERADDAARETAAGFQQ